MQVLGILVFRNSAANAVAMSDLLRNTRESSTEDDYEETDLLKVFKRDKAAIEQNKHCKKKQ